MNQIIYDFVRTFFPEHKRFWENLTEEEMAFLNTIPYNEDTLKKVVFFPEENVEAVEKFRNKTKDLEIIIAHRECVFDFYLYRKLSIYCSNYFESKYDFIFDEPGNYSAQIKELKTIKGYMNKIYDLLPSVYTEHKKEKYSREEAVFGTFYEHIDSVTFKSHYERIEFKRSQMNLIPYFIEYRNTHLIEWILKDYEEKKEKQKNERLPANEAYEFYGLKSKLYVVEQYLIVEAEKRIRALLNKYNYFSAEVEKGTNCFTVRYSAKDSLFGSMCTYKIFMNSLDENLEKFELALAG